MKFSEQRKQQPQPESEPRESFAVIFERAPGGKYRIQVAITSPTGQRTVLRPRTGEVTCSQLIAVTEIDHMHDRLQDWIVGKYIPSDDRTLEPAT